MNTTYKVILDGDIVPGAHRSRVLLNAGKLFKLEPTKADKLLGGKPRVVKKNLDQITAQRYVETISQAGLICRMEAENSFDDFSGDFFSPSPPREFSCPRCGFHLAAGSVDWPLKECPRCGIVVEKYLKGQGSADKSGARGNPQSMVRLPKKENEPASEGQRLFAALGTLFVASAVINMLRPFIAVFLYINNYTFLSRPITDTAGAAVSLASINTLQNQIIWPASIVLLFAYFIYAPMKNGATYAQKLMNIRVVCMNPEKYPNIITWLLRTLGNFLCTATMGLLFLVPLFRNDGRSLADLVSGTQQVKQGKLTGADSVLMTILVIISIAVSLGSWYFSHMLLTPPPTVDRVTVLEHENRNILEEISKWEASHFREYGTYSDEGEMLFNRYGNPRSLISSKTLVAILDGRLQLETTESGFRASMPASDESDVYHTYTEEGDQGMEPDDL